MFYIIGPARSAEAMARKNGLRKDEWRHVGRLADARGRSFGARDIVLSTHDSHHLADSIEIVEYVESHSHGKQSVGD